MTAENATSTANWRNCITCGKRFKKTKEKDLCCSKECLEEESLAAPKLEDYLF